MMNFPTSLRHFMLRSVVIAAQWPIWSEFFFCKFSLSFEACLRLLKTKTTRWLPVRLHHYEDGSLRNPKKCSETRRNPIMLIRWHFVLNNPHRNEAKPEFWLAARLVYQSPPVGWKAANTSRVHVQMRSNENGTEAKRDFLTFREAFLVWSWWKKKVEKKFKIST